MARGVARRAGVRAPRRSRIWDALPIPLAQTAGGSSVFTILVTEAALLSQGKPTIARMRGAMHVQMDRSAEVAEDKALVTYGIAMLEGRAVAAGVASLPTPATNGDFPWMWIGTATIASPTTLTEDEGAMRFERTLIDAKAMRKAGPGELLVMVTEVTSITGTPDVECWGFIRVLLMPS